MLLFALYHRDLHCLKAYLKPRGKLKNGSLPVLRLDINYLLSLCELAPQDFPPLTTPFFAIRDLTIVGS